MSTWQSALLSRQHATDRGDWRNKAACADHDPEMWFPLPQDRATEEAALTICHACPVRTPCLDWAREHAEEAGIWGGYTERDRRAERWIDAATVRDLATRRCSDQQIAQRLGTTIGAVRHVRRRHSIPAGQSPHNQRWADQIRPVLTVLHQQGLSNEQIAARFGVARRTVGRWRDALIREETPA